MTDQASTPDDDEEARLVALSRFAKASATALQGALQFAAQSEQSLATSVAALVDEGLTVDDVAVRVGLRREYVQQLLEGSLKTDRLL